MDVSMVKRVLNKQLSPDAEVPVYSANVKEPFGYIDDLLITDFSVPSILWGIDGDWIRKRLHFILRIIVAFCVSKLPR